MAIFSNKNEQPAESTTYNIDVSHDSERASSIPVHVAKDMGGGAVALTQINESVNHEDIRQPVDLTLQKRLIEQSLEYIESGTFDPASMSYDIRDVVAEIRKLGVDGSVEATLAAILKECGAIESKSFSGMSANENIQAIRNLLTTL